MKLTKNSHIIKLISALLALMFIAVMTVPMAGCNKDDDTESDTTTAPPEEDDEPRIPRVGFIYSGSVEGSAHNKMWDDARLTIERQLGAETRYVEDVFFQNFREAVEMLVSAGVDTIVSTSHFFVSAVQEAARAYQGVNFISFGGGVLAANLTTFQPLLYQPAHAAGLAAAHNVAAGIGAMGVVVDPRMYNINGVINSFIQGAKFNFDSGLDIHIRYIDSRSESEARQAINELRALGLDTVLCYLDTDYAIRYAEQSGMKTVGYANNIAELAPINHIAGFYFNVNNYLTEQINALYHHEGAMRPAATVGGLATGHTHVSPLNPRPGAVLLETHRLFNQVRASIVDGTAIIFAGEIRDNHGTVQVETGVSLDTNEILNMSWLEFSVGSNFYNLYEPTSSPAIVPLWIRLGDNARAARDAAREAAAAGNTTEGE
jgi:basic membrane lipoprotein Med (substrate-binding protein (PBP1-ABC) superfamily)